MRMVLLASGSRGDVQPMVALGAELRGRGHQVSFGAPPNLVSFASLAGFDVRPIGPDSQVFLQSAEGQELLAAGNTRELVAGFAKIGHLHLEQAHREILEVTQGADLIVAGVLVAEHAAAVAEVKRIPIVLVHFVPVSRTRAYPAFPITTRHMGGMVNVLTWSLFEWVAWKAFGPDVNRIRAWLGLPEVLTPIGIREKTRDVLQIQAFSPAIVPGIDDYGTNRPIVGSFRLSPDVRHALGESGPDSELERWLSDGDPPVYFGFGSMPVREPTAALSMIDTAIRRLGLRALVSAGWSNLGHVTSDERVRIVGSLNHDAVLPRCRLAVHHGGAGTTAASLAAGLPTLVCSVFADQPFWGAQMERLGVGAHLRFARLNRENLERGLRQVLQPEIAERARALAASMRQAPNATAYAADLIETRTGVRRETPNSGSARVG